jgi:hypothetical protein
MNLKQITDGWKSLAGKMNSNGIPIPLARDPSTNKGSVPFTLVLLSTLLIVVGIVGKWSGHLGGIDMAAAMQFFYTSCSLFFGHSWVHQETRLPDGKIQDLDLKTGDENKPQ